MYRRNEGGGEEEPRGAKSGRMGFVGCGVVRPVFEAKRGPQKNGSKMAGHELQGKGTTKGWGLVRHKPTPGKGSKKKKNTPVAKKKQRGKKRALVRER